MVGDTDEENHEIQSLNVRLLDYSTDELLEELARRFRSASGELERLRAGESGTSEKDPIGSPGQRLPETADGLLAMINLGPRLGDDGIVWDVSDPNTSPKLLRKKATVKLARMWGQMALDPARLRNGEINRRLMERETGVPRNTMRPYLDAGLALYKAGRLYVDDDPSDVDIRIVERSLEEGERGRMRESKSKTRADR